MKLIEGGQMDILLQNYENLIYRKCWNLVEKFQLDKIYDFEDLYESGIEIFYDCLKKFNSMKSNFITFLYHQLNRLNYIAKKKSDYYNEIENYYNYYEGRAMQDFNIVDFYDVEDDSKLIFKYLIDKWDFEITKQEVKMFFVKELGWQYKRFEKAWQDCKKFVDSI